MKRYLLFAGQTYYAAGGALDLIDDYDDLDAAISYAKKHSFDEDDSQLDEDILFDWWHVLDTEAKQIAAAHGQGETGNRYSSLNVWESTLPFKWDDNKWTSS